MGLVSSAIINGAHLRGISHLVIEVTEPDRAHIFYGDILGLPQDREDDWPVADERAFSLPSGQWLVFKPAHEPRTFADSGVHQAYRCAPEAIAAIQARLESDGVTIHRYHEDRPVESVDGFYFTDPDANRIQLVPGPKDGPGTAAIDHAGVQATDMEWEEAFFVDRLGFPIDHRVGWNTADFVRAQAWADGKEDMAPGTRRMDHRYRDIPGSEPGEGREVPRPNVQIFLGLGDAVLGIFLATRFDQEPPPDQARGTPRVGIAMDGQDLVPMGRALAAAGAAVEGPISHPAGSPLAASLYFRDPCGNFFEICAPAEGKT